MTTTNRDIPLLLREKLREDVDLENILGYHYSIGYNTEDWDFPIQNYYYEQEENWIDGTHKVSGSRDNSFFCEQIHWGKVPDEPFVAKNRGYYDYYHKKHRGYLSMLCWAYIDVFYKNGDEQETIRIEGKDSQSVVYGDFEGLRMWLENEVTKRVTEKGVQPSNNQHIRLTARNVLWKKTEIEEIGPVEFEMSITDEEAEAIRTCMLGSENYSPNSYGSWAEKGAALLVESYGPQSPSAHLHIDWAKGERQRMISGCSFLTQYDIESKLSFLDSLGDTPPIREELLAGIEDCFIWEETWTRETGHLWRDYTLLKRTLSEEEFDYADCSQKPFRLRKLTTAAILNLFEEYKVSQNNKSCARHGERIVK